MPDRRRSHRYLLRAPESGYVRMQQDVVVGRASGNRLVAFASSPAAAGELFQLLRTTGEGTVNSREARVVESRPVLRAGIVQFRLDLQLQRPRTTGPAGMALPE
jgi:hypothetical protein